MVMLRFVPHRQPTKRPVYVFYAFAGVMMLYISVANAPADIPKAFVLRVF